MTTQTHRQTVSSSRSTRSAKVPRNPTDATEKKLKNLKPFKPGAEWTGNASGRPPGSRNKLCAQYIDDLQTVWKEEGIKAIRAAARKRPVAFMNAVGNLVPREFDLGDRTRDVGFVEIWRALANGTLGALLSSGGQHNSTGAQHGDPD